MPEPSSDEAVGETGATMIVWYARAIFMIFDCQNMVQQKSNNNIALCTLKLRCSK